MNYKLKALFSLVLCFAIILTSAAVAMASERVNVALGKPVITDLADNTTNRISSDITDGNKEASSGTGATGRAWFVHKDYTDTEENYIEINLGAYYTIDGAAMYSGYFNTQPAGGNCFTDYTLMYHDGDGYRAIPGGLAEGVGHGAYEMNFTKPVVTDRVKIVDNMTTHYQIREFELYGTFHSSLPVNAALGKPVTTNMASYSQRNDTDLTDGVIDKGTGGDGAWYVHINHTSTAENYIEIDLGAIYTLSSATIRSGSSDNGSSDLLTAYTLYYYDGSSYQMVPGAQVTGATGLSNVEFTEQVTTNKVKLVENMTTAYRIREIEVYGSLEAGKLGFGDVVFDISNDGYITAEIDVENYTNIPIDATITLAAYDSEKKQMLKSAKCENIRLRIGKYTLSTGKLLEYKDDFIYKLFVWNGDGDMSPFMPEVTFKNIIFEGELLETSAAVYKPSGIFLPVESFYAGQTLQITEFKEAESYLLTDDCSHILVTPDDNKVYTDNEEIELESAPILTDGTLYLPIEFAQKCLKRKVDISENSVCIGEREPIVVDETNGKKVYALYHGFRRTRETDGDLGSWKVFYDTSASQTGIAYINYNPDLVDEQGYHQVAAADGSPIVGMYSDRDEDYIEYKILLAKTGGLDGFMMDYVFPQHGNTVMVNDFVKVAEKYDFEIGVDWLDSSVYNTTWVQNYEGYEDVDTREELTEFSKSAVQYALSNVYGSKVGAKFNDKPLFFLFGDGAKTDELAAIMSENYILPDGMANPIYVRRAQVAVSTKNDELIIADLPAMAQPWSDIGVDVFSWIGRRVRDSADVYPQWDKYATFQDNLDFAQAYIDLWRNNDKCNVNVATVWPGFDNRGCASWGGGTFLGIDRAGGTLYNELWEQYLDNKEQIDIMFIASWSDFTEGHEIEPTVTQGYRELISTQRYTAEFKESQKEVNPNNLYLPQKLFELRKTFDKLQKIGFDTDEAVQLMDTAAKLISEDNYSVARGLLNLTDKLSTEYFMNVTATRVTITSDELNITNSTVNPDSSFDTASGLSFKISDDIADKLTGAYYEGFINYSYYGDDNKTFTIKSDTARTATDKIGLTYGDYSIIAQITKNSSDIWENCRTKLYKDNIRWDNGGNIVFKGNADIKDISLEFDIYEKLQ